MMPGTVHGFKTETAFATLVVGDPEIADVSVYSDQDFSIIAKKEGVTTIVALTKTKSVAGVFSISVHPSVIVYRTGRQFQLYNCHVDGGCFPAKGSGHTEPQPKN
jgi:hypothetical protein